MSASAGSFLSGLSREEREWLENTLEHRHFAQGSVILAEGDAPHEMYIILSGLAEVSIVDPFSIEHHISSVSQGDSIGEMSILSGQPISATVRATTDVEVLALPATEFTNVFSNLPVLYRNLGAVLSNRLARTNRRSLQQKRGSVCLLNNRGAPPLMGYALACSVAWHTRRPTLLVRYGDFGESDPQLEQLLTSRLAPEASGKASPPLAEKADATAPGAILLTCNPDGDFAPERIRATIEDLCDRYQHVLIETTGPLTLADLPEKEIILNGPDGPGDSTQADAGRYTLRGWSARSPRVGPGRDGVLSVPAPSEAEMEDLLSGMLSIQEGAGRTLGWAARDISRNKIGLALGAGSIKGYAHIGVLEMLERWNVPVDFISGTSVGAALASSYALGFSPEVCAKMLDRVGGRAFRLTVPRHGMLSSDGLREGLRRVGRDRRIEDSRIPLSIIAADINTGLEVVLKEGLIWSAVLASMAIPGIYPPIPMGDYMLVDGGVLNPVPTDAVSNMGADTVIAVKLARRESDLALEAVSTEPSSSPPLIIQTISRSIEIMQSKIVTESAAAATITIEPVFPDVTGWGLRTFGHGEPFIEVGRQAAERALPRLSTAIPWLSD